ncbi:multidrug effflux MFS transporter [Gilvimarinus sp. SDUM040013]|uniref:Bcr/CflA family efflux transporter n=1 Tax=Gilvimarinus gilvus TaxID=3058038 RepID=A0ABU4RSG4_9GAMM|nr:multidrug effflux MFS transporter [Gilvimarinus sp. SDUM040013]MDO3388281.1 multidrug effflux MFS transporter [Gilvimarinus sp. SDUM040013]MDX6847831.1 multidrug effflux MFS transporter [Gilvimarinus sp. SDUM040013]
MPYRQLPHYFLLYLGALVALGPVAMDAYLPALPTMSEKLGVSIATLSTSVSTFLVGFALGQLLGGPISDQVGRKPVCLFGTVLFIATSAAISASESASAINLLRFTQAFGGGFASITAMAQVRDAYPAEEIGSRFATVMMVMMIAPVIAPIIGTGLLYLGWQAIFIFQVVYAVSLLAVMHQAIPETLQHQKTPLSLPRIFYQYTAIVMHRTHGHYLAALFALSMGSTAGILLIFVTHASFTYMTYFGVGEGVFSILFGLNAIGLIIANGLSSRLLKFCNPLRVFQNVVILQTLATVLMAVLIYTNTLSLAMAVPLIVFIVSCVGVSNPAGAARFMAMFAPQQGGSAAAIQLVAMFVLGSVMGALASVWHDGSLKPMVNTMLICAFISTALLLPLRKLRDTYSGNS